MEPSNGLLLNKTSEPLKFPLHLVESAPKHPWASLGITGIMLPLGRADELIPLHIIVYMELGSSHK